MEEDQGFETEPSRAERHRVADRPHVWTIAIGLLSPSLALVALWVSWSTLEVNNRANASDIVIRNATLSVRDADAKRMDFSGVARVVAFSHEFDVVNLGKGVGEIRSINLRHTVFPGWKEIDLSRFAPENDGIFEEVRRPYLPQGSSSKISTMLMFGLSDNAYVNFKLCRDGQPVFASSGLAALLGGFGTVRGQVIVHDRLVGRYEVTWLESIPGKNICFERE